MEPLKNMYTPELLVDFASKVCRVYPAFDRSQFLDKVFDSDWDSRELKQRYRHITMVLGSMLPESYEEAIAILFQLREECRGFPYMFFPDFIEVYGLEHWDTSILALMEFTSMNSSEFAVRPFIEKDQDRMLDVMLQWADHTSEHVRRLASEGCRPRLPWAPPLLRLKADPSPILPILERLKEDESEYVRKSVANNLNDISKDHPDLVLSIAERWLADGNTKTNWIVKHGCRTLLKKGDPRALRLFGFGNADILAHVTISDLTITPATIHIGEEIRFSFTLSSEEPATFRLQFAVDYVKANNKTSQKRFHLPERKGFQGTETIERKLSFQDLSTRKHYPGIHRLSVLVNGIEAASANFQLKP